MSDAAKLCLLMLSQVVIAGLVLGLTMHGAHILVLLCLIALSATFGACLLDFWQGRNK